MTESRPTARQEWYLRQHGLPIPDTSAEAWQIINRHKGGGEEIHGWASFGDRAADDYDADSEGAWEAMGELADYPQGFVPGNATPGDRYITDRMCYLPVLPRDMESYLHRDPADGMPALEAHLYERAAHYDYDQGWFGEGFPGDDVGDE